MTRNKLRSRQRGTLNTRMRIVIGTTIFAAASLMLFVIINVGSVKDTRAFSAGDYRSVASGDWNDVQSWEVYDGKSWSEAPMPPSTAVNSIVISDGREIILNDDITFSNLIIDEGGSLKMDANEIKIAKFNGKGGLICNGKLDMGETILSGNGDFIAGSKSTVSIGSENGIDKKGLSGNLQLTGKRVLNRDAFFVFNGTLKQHSGNGLPGVLRNLIIDNPYGVDLDQSVFITDKLTLKRGIISSGKFVITLGASPVSTGEIEKFSGSISGKIRRWYGPGNFKEIVFPMSDGNSSNIFIYASDITEFQKGMIEMNYFPGKLEESNRSPFDARQFIVGITEKGYFSASLTNGAEEAWLKITSAIADKNDNKISWKITNRKQNKVAAGEKVEKPSQLQNLFCGPNPFTDHFAVRFFSESANETTIQLMNSNGQEMHKENIKVKEGNNQYEFSSDKDLTPGIYIIRLSNASEIHTLKIVKDK